MATLFCEDLREPEGPVRLPDGSWLVTETHPDRGCVTHLSPDAGRRRPVARTGRSDGLALSGDGAVWVAESSAPSAVLRIDLDGQEHARISEVAGEVMLWCNDICCGPDVDAEGLALHR